MMEMQLKQKKSRLPQHIVYSQIPLLLNNVINMVKTGDIKNSS